MLKCCFIDLETTGTKFWRSGIHQISGLIEIDGTIKKTFDYKVKPHPDCTIEDEALRVGNVTREMIASYPDMNLVYDDIVKMLGRYVNKYSKTDKFFLVGYNNASFDNAFFRAFFVQNGDQYFGSWFFSSCLDVMVLAAEYLKERRHEMENFQLKTVAKYLGIEVDESMLHNSLYDVQLTRQIYKIITKPELVKIY